MTEVRIALCAEDLLGAENAQAVVASIAEAVSPKATLRWIGEQPSSFRKLRRAAKGSNKFGTGPRERGDSNRKIRLPVGPALKVALNAWFAAKDTGDLVIVATDIDRKPARRLSDDERKVLRSWKPPMIVAEMDPEAEAWRIVLGGDSPHLAALSAELSFDPTKQPERMNSTTGNARDCKIVAKRLFPSGSESALAIPVGEHHP